jgi:hypothetical protein
MGREPRLDLGRERENWEEKEEKRGKIAKKRERKGEKLQRKKIKRAWEGSQA